MSEKLHEKLQNNGLERCACARARFSFCSRALPQISSDLRRLGPLRGTLARLSLMRKEVHDG
jgi:hypothetical protein